MPEEKSWQVSSFAVFMKQIHEMCKREVVLESVEKRERRDKRKKSRNRETRWGREQIER